MKVESQSTNVAVVSDTHGALTQPLVDALEELAPNVIVHAGDVIYMRDFDRLSQIAPVHMVLGNNDWQQDFPGASRVAHLTIGGLAWEVNHFRERLDLSSCNIAVCGHTHRPYIDTLESGMLVMNPGSPTFPRSAVGPTFGHILIEDSTIKLAEIIPLDEY